MAYTESKTRADITVAGVHLGIADAWSGGEKTSDGTYYQRATGPKALGAPPTRNDGKATYLFDEAFAAIFRKLDTMVGRGDKRATIALTVVSDDGTPFPGGAIQLSGFLKTLPPPPGDPKSADPAEMDLEFTLNPDLS